MARSGRRRGESGTREAILDGALAEFAEFGYERATIRGIARRAGVDPALVHHYFKNKEQVFVAAMRLPFNPAELAGEVLGGDRDQIGIRLAAMLARTWEVEANRQPLIALIRSAVSNEQAAAMMREFATEALIGRIAAQLGAPDARLRATLAASHVLGLILARYIIKVEPLASLPVQEIAAAIGPTLQRYLTADLGTADLAAVGTAPQDPEPELGLEERRGSVK